MDTSRAGYDAELEGETWGADRAQSLLTDCTEGTEGTEGSDFTPSELARMNRKTSHRTAPLPRGVPDVRWEPPVATGLENSSAIFQTESDERGRLLLSGEGLSETNRHFRSWQEDNGVAGAFAQGTVEKEVDGKTMRVAVARESSSFMQHFARASTMMRPSTADALSSGPLLKERTTAAVVPDVRVLRTLRRCSSAGECGREAARRLGDKEAAAAGERGEEEEGSGFSSPEGQGGAAGQSSSSRDVAGDEVEVAATPQGLSSEQEVEAPERGAVSASAPGMVGENRPSNEKLATATGQSLAAAAATAAAAGISSQEVSALPPQGLSAEDEAPERGPAPGRRAQPSGGRTTPASEGQDGGPSPPATVASSRVAPATPRRPSDSVASSHAREPRPGRSFATQVLEARVNLAYSRSPCGRGFVASFSVILVC